MREGCDPLALSRGWFGGNLDFRRCRKVLRWRCWFSAARRAVRMRISFPTARAWVAPLPYTPSGDGVREGCDPLALSRGWFGGNLGFRRFGKRLRWRFWFSAARRAGSAGIWVSDDAGNGFGGDAGYWRREGLVRREFGFPTIRETASVEMPVFGGAKRCSDEDFVSDDAGVGRSAPLHPLGGRGVRGLRPSHALPGLGWREFRFPTMQETASVEMLVFGDVKGCSFEDFGFRRRGRGALRSPTPPRGTGCERVATLSRSPGGWAGGNLDYRRCKGVFLVDGLFFSSKWERLPASAETGFGRF